MYLLLLILEERLSVFIIEYVSWGFFINDIFILPYVPPICILLRILNHKLMLNFVNIFCICWYDHVSYPSFIYQLGSVQSLSGVQLFMTPWTAAHQASLSITNSGSLLKLMSIELVMPSNIICHFDFLWILNHPCIPELNPTLSWCVILLIYYWVWFSNILFKFLHLNSSGILTYKFLHFSVHFLFMVSE